MRRRAIVGAMLLGTFLFLALIGLGVRSSASDDTKELQLLHVVVRHGARTPADTYPNDPHINDTFYPFGWGQLTNAGKLQVYELGKYLRRRYDKFLGSQYSVEEYYVQSTDSDRTMTTAQTINAGLWPPAHAQKWGPLDWQPIPVHSEPLNQDHLLLVRTDCPQYNLELRRVIQTEEIQSKLRENEKLFEELSKCTGRQIRDFEDVQDLYSTLKAEESFNLTLPTWTRDYYPDKLEPLTIFSYVLNAYTDVLKRLKGGVLLKRLLLDWRQKRAGTLNRKAFLFVGHDSTIANILRALDAWHPQIPGYGTAILFELSRDKITGKYGVEVFLRKDGASEPYRLRVRGCEEFCELDKLVELTTNVVPVDWAKECEVDDSNYTPPPLRGP